MSFLCVARMHANFIFYCDCRPFSKTLALKPALTQLQSHSVCCIFCKIFVSTTASFLNVNLDLKHVFFVRRSHAC